MSQNKSILKALKRGKSITQVQAYKKFGCTRLAARIADLRACGMSEYHLYEQLKAEWVKRNPNATSEAYEAAISEIALELGL